MDQQNWDESNHVNFTDRRSVSFYIKWEVLIRVKNGLLLKKRKMEKSLVEICWRGIGKTKKQKWRYIEIQNLKLSPSFIS